MQGFGILGFRVSGFRVQGNGVRYLDSRFTSNPKHLLFGSLGTAGVGTVNSRGLWGLGGFGFVGHGVKSVQDLGLWVFEEVTIQIC